MNLCTSFALCRVAIIEIVLKQQDALIAPLRKGERFLQKELSSCKRSTSTEIEKYFVDRQSIMESNQKRELAEHNYEAQVQRNSELHNRCEELTAQAEKERLSRYGCDFFALEFIWVFGTHWMCFVRMSAQREAVVRSKQIKRESFSRA